MTGEQRVADTSTSTTAGVPVKFTGWNAEYQCERNAPSCFDTGTRHKNYDGRTLDKSFVNVERLTLGTAKPNTLILYSKYLQLGAALNFGNTGYNSVQTPPPSSLMGELHPDPQNK